MHQGPCPEYYGFMRLKNKLHEVIFEAETPAGKAFDIVLIAFILLSVAFTMMESVESIHKQWVAYFFYSEVVFTLFFSVEYLLRLYSSRNTFSYAFSFFGLVDLLATLPFYVAIFLPGASSLTIIRGLRIMRVFRVLKLNKFALAGQHLSKSLKESWPKIFVFLTTIITAVTIMGALMYIIEGRANGFTSIPKGVYWAVVTMTTVGYGDLSPQTPMGQFISVVLMVLGYGVIAVPTGIVSSEILREENTKMKLSLTRTCPNCFKEGHEVGAHFCSQCGSTLNEPPKQSSKN